VELFAKQELVHHINLESAKQELAPHTFRISPV